MQSEIAKYLKRNGFNTSKMKVHVYESITTENETGFEGTVDAIRRKRVFRPICNGFQSSNT